MDLFNQDINFSKNLLPADGVVNYESKLLDTDTANYYFNRLLSNIAWENDKVVIFGKTIITKRKVAWYGDQSFEYRYSNTTKKALIWTDDLLELKQLTEEKCGEQFNSCLLNLYHSGEEGMAWHSDAEKDLKRNGAIGSLSLGAQRKFDFKHKKTNETCSIFLEHGSLLLMKDTTQTNWLHRLAPSKRIKNPRINLTFRSINQ